MKRLIAVFITLVLFLVVVPFALIVAEDEKAELTEVELLKKKLTLCIGRLALEYNSNIRDLQMAQPTTDKEKKE